MKPDGGPQCPAVIVGPGQYQARYQILDHQQKIGDILLYHGELPHVEQCEQQTAHHIGQGPAPALQITEHQPPEQHLLHEGRQENDNQQRHVWRVVDLGGDGGVVEVGAVGENQVRQPVHQLIQAIQPHQSCRRRLAGAAQIIHQVPGGPGQEAVENNDRHGEQDVVVQHIPHGGGNRHCQQAPGQIKQRVSDKRQHQQVDDEEHHPSDLLSVSHISCGFAFCHRNLLCMPAPP